MPQVRLEVVGLGTIQVVQTHCDFSITVFGDEFRQRGGEQLASAHAEASCQRIRRQHEVIGKEN